MPTDIIEHFYMLVIAHVLLMPKLEIKAGKLSIVGNSASKQIT
jgi:hypothetical protein